MRRACIGNSTDDCYTGDPDQKAEVICGLVLVILVAGVLYAVHQTWHEKEEKRKMATGVLNQSSAYAVNLVRHFMPSLKVAKYQFRGMQPPKHKIDIAFHDLGLELKNGAKVLSGVTGEFRAGRMVAIMGPSGAGKTTFMNVLCGKATYGKMCGEILINGHHLDIHQINSVVGFVPQDDIVHENLTVREQIRFAAQMRNKVGTSKRRIESITDDVLNVMQIDHIQNSIVGGVEARGISGGQRKRVNIGLELAAQPTLLFLDEPTSGLDSTSSLAVVYSLKKMCQLGMTCIMVIHQPRYSLFTLFDDVLLLGKGGHTVYLGPSLGAKSYFDDLGFEMPKDENRADWFMDVISGEVENSRIPNFEPKRLFDLWELRCQNGGGKCGHVHSGGVAAKEGSPRLRAGAEPRLLTKQEDSAVLMRALEEEWDRIDINRDGTLERSELKHLMSRCSNLEPSDEVVRELFARMAGPTTDVVTKKDFVTFLSNLQSDVADDRMCSDGHSPAGMLGSASAVLPFLNIWHQQAGGASVEDWSSSGSEGDSDPEDGFGSSEEGVLRALRRQTPGFTQQLHILLLRTVIQWWRVNPSRCIYFTAMGIGSIVLAIQDIVVGSPKWDAMSFVNTHTCVGLLVTIFCLTVFDRDQPIFWRERNRGLNVLAFFESRLHLNLIDLTMQTFLFTALYYLIRGIHVSFFVYWVPFILVSYAASAWGYVIAAWLPPQHGPFIASLVIFVVCGLLGNPQNMSKFAQQPVLEVGVSLISITRWSIPMSFMMQVHRTKPQPAEGQEKFMFEMYKKTFDSGTLDFGLGYWWSGVWALLAYGTVLRVVAYLGLLLRNRDKQV